jgi:hypothetical protein
MAHPLELAVRSLRHVEKWSASPLLNQYLLRDKPQDIAETIGIETSFRQTR